MVASTMPMTATFSVFRTPISSARPIGIDRRIVGEQGFADRDAGDAAEEAEAGGDVARGEVADGVADQIPGDRDDDADDDDLPDDGAENRVGPGQPHAAPRGGSGGDQARIGGGLGHRAAVSDATG